MVRPATAKPTTPTTTLRWTTHSHSESAYAGCTPNNEPSSPADRSGPAGRAGPPCHYYDYLDPTSVENRIWGDKIETSWCDADGSTLLSGVMLEACG
jgi:hypothetical protein